MRLHNRLLSAHLPVSSSSLRLKLEVYRSGFFTARNKTLLRELPDLTEVIGLLLSSGLPVGVALSWIQPRITGQISSEVDVVIGNVNLGADLSSELKQASQRLSDSGFSELVEKLAMSLDRGAPVADQIMQLAASLRQEQGRLLLRQAGSSETKMLIPTVFVILPVTVLFAVFPSVLVLQQSF